jgi:hypothetical protein
MNLTPTDTYRQRFDKLAKMLRTYIETCKYTIEIIDPETAAEMVLLRKSTVPLRKAEIQKISIYARLMKARAWKINGDAIVFDETGALLDGAARLHACIEAGVSFPTIVFRGVPAGAGHTLNAHIKRTSSDILDINNEEFPYTIAGAWPILITYLNAPSKHQYVKTQAAPVTSTEMLRLNERYPSIRASARLVKETRAANLMGEAVATACHFIMSLEDPALADRFIRIVDDPELDPTSAASTLSSRLANLGRTPQTFRFAIAAKAWNRFRQGKQIGASGLVYNGKQENTDNTHNNEAFPVFGGVPESFRIDLGDGIRDNTEVVSSEEQVDESEAYLEIAIVSPGDCGRFLDRNGPEGSERNRKIRERHFRALARDMRTGDWWLNAQPLKFGKSGRLIDGQHRCKAGIESGMPFITFIVRGLDDGVFSTYDGGQRKNLVSYLAPECGANTTSLASSLNMLHRILNNTTSQLTNTEGLKLHARHPEIGRSVAKVSTRAMRDFLPVSVAGTLHYLFSKRDGKQADAFFDDLTEGAEIGKADPLLRLRNTLTLKTKESQYPLPDQKAKVTILTWNARRKGKPLTRYVLPPLGYPTIL